MASLSVSEVKLGEISATTDKLDLGRTISPTINLELGPDNLGEVKLDFFEEKQFLFQNGEAFIIQVRSC